MAFSRAHPPPLADAGGHRGPYRSASFYDGAAASTSSTTIAAAASTSSTTIAAASDNSSHQSYSRKHRVLPFNDGDAAGVPPPLKRRKPVAAPWGQDSGRRYNYAIASDAPSTTSAPYPPPRGHAAAASSAPPAPVLPEEVGLAEDATFMSKDEIERCSPSRKDGIDSFFERQLRYSYCAYLQSLGMRLQLPHTTVGTAMVLCHRFFLRRSHATHDRFLIATAAVFLASKSEETPCLLNTVLRVSCEICQEQNFAFYPYLLYSDWFEQYRERVIEAEQMILMTLDFELEVQHPFIPLTSVLNKLGLSRSVLLNLAWTVVSEGLRTSLWLQFKPHHIAAGAAFLAAKFLNFDLSYNQNIWHEFQTTPSILEDVVQQLMEVF